MSIYQKIERVEHKDPTLGLVNLKEKNGEWTGEQGLKITAEKGKVVAGIKTGEGGALKSIVRRFEPSAKLDSFEMKDSKAKIDVKINVGKEEAFAKEFMEQVNGGVAKPVYKSHRFEPEQGALIWREPGKGWIVIDVIKDDREIGVVVVESSIHNSVERVDTKKFSVNNKLLVFDSATEYGETPRINVGREEDAIDKLLKMSNVKLREKAERQNEFDKHAAC